MKISTSSLVVGVVLALGSLFSLPAKQNINILWVGNSFTGLGDLPALEKEIINTCDTSLNVVSSSCNALWGQGLDAQYNSQPVMDSIRSGRYRYVVVQGYLNSGSADFRTTMVQTTLQYGPLIIAEIKKANSIPIVFLHQVNQNSQANQWDTVIGTYARLAKSTNSTIAPCGIAWRRAITAHPDLNLWGTADGLDNHHQGSYGIYLNACVFYMVMTGKTPVGISVRHAKNVNTGAYRTFTADTALFLQQYAFGAVDSCVKAGGTAVRQDHTPSSPHGFAAHWSTTLIHPGLRQRPVAGKRGYTLRGMPLRNGNQPGPGVVIYKW